MSTLRRTPARPASRPGARSGSSPSRGATRPQVRRTTTRPAAPTRTVRATEHAETVLPSRKASLTGRAAILAVVLVVLLLSFAYPLRNWFDQRTDLGDLHAEIAGNRAAIAELERSVARWDDDEYVRAQARDRLRYVMPGEVGYVVIGEDFAAPDLDAEVVASTWWQRLWGTVEAVDDGDAAAADGADATDSADSADTAPSAPATPPADPAPSSTVTHLPD